MRLAWIAVWLPALCAQVVPHRYIVEFEGQPAAVSAASRRALESPRRAVRAEQARLRPQLQRAGARVIAGVETVANGLIVEVSADQVAQVSSLAGGARLHLVRLARPYLG
jgi:hypothetical protein